MDNGLRDDVPTDEKLGVRRIRLRHWLLVLMAFACLACGCSLGPVNTPSFADDASVRRIDPNHGPFVIIDVTRLSPKPGQKRAERRIQWKNPRIDPNLNGAPTFAAKYRSLEFRLFSRVSVPVRLGQRRKHWALVDTGYAGSLYINDAVIRDCNLAVFPMGEHPETGSAAGLCEVPAMQIGQATVGNPPCSYEQRQWQLRLFGLPLYRDRMVLIGLRFLRAFPFVLFDNARREVVFSPYDVFEPDDPSQWLSLPFALEGTTGKLRIMVDISLGPRDVRVEFDTGGAKPGLILREDVWRDVGGGAGAKGRHASIQFGWLPCRRVVVPELRVGPLILQDRKADIMAQDSPLLEGIEGLLSLDYFKKTSVVLDFKQNRIWIRQP